MTDSAIIAAAIAALGFVAKQGFDAVTGLVATRRSRRAQLVELQSLLSASNVANKIQKEHATVLAGTIMARLPELASRSTSDEAIIFSAYKQNMMDEAEREQHGMIRSITINSLMPTNAAMLDWLQKDRYFRVAANHTDRMHELATKLGKLHSHLILWKAKYDCWISSNPAHAFVYMADESGHGLGFPEGLDEEVNSAVKGRLPWF